MPNPFHIAFPVDDLEAARRFYGELLGCPEGRSSDTWIDFDLFGHQIVAHRVGDDSKNDRCGLVDAKEVQIPHFGVVLDMEDWKALAEKLTARGTEFVMPPQIRFVGMPGEQATMFLLDPAGNAIEFKAFADMKQLFAKH
ncbi:VOC family protein [Nguyenibacter vanlangensis]|uniref:VOC family protein n=1 Tax=Nguyenibacter vanlangensis TaxID=1216886 RepID=A0ABZ3DA72_9PROT